MKTLTVMLLACLAAAALNPRSTCAADPIKVMIIGGQNNHNWSLSTPYMKELLDRNPHFQATICNAPERGADQAAWDAWQPKFSDYDVILLDYNGQMWPDRIKTDFVQYVQDGGNVVVIHAANNAFTGWKEFEQMVGLLWRNPNYGYSLYVDEDGQVVREEPGEGRRMGHGSQYDWKMTVRAPEHPITAGMPLHWMHKHDELYHGQRGPAENINILLTAFSDPNRGGTGKHEPIVWWVPYGKGKVLTNLMGHVGQLGCMHCVGFQVLLYRSCEWLAAGKCQTPIPEDFPTAESTSLNP
jgi:uncharacterized protein